MTQKPSRPQSQLDTETVVRAPVSSGDAAQSQTGPGPWLDHSRIFAGSRPASVRRGLEPAFLLFESEVMESLHRRAAQRGLAYDALVRMIVRDHVEEY
ncbi:MAG: hypothetical protein AB7V27_04205 [Candidatus Binatia bacterium]